jgi:excisionase family DNA binding protein
LDKGQSEKDGVGPDPRQYGLFKAAYTVKATAELLSIGRTSLYAAIKEGNLHPVKCGSKTLFYAADIAKFLASLPKYQVQLRDQKRIDR